MIGQYGASAPSHQEPIGAAYTGQQANQIVPRPHGKQADSWWSATAPATNVALAAITWVGVDFKPTVAGRIAGFRYWVPAGVPAPNRVIMWDSATLHLLRAHEFRQDVTPPVNDWMQTWFRPWYRVVVGAALRMGVLAGSGYHRNNAALASAVTHNGIQFLESWQSTSIHPPGVTITTNTNANGVDILFQAD